MKSELYDNHVGLAGQIQGRRIPSVADSLSHEREMALANRARRMVRMEDGNVAEDTWLR